MATVAANSNVYARRAAHITTATTTAVAATRLHRVIVGTGVTSATVTVRYADDDTVISIIDAASPGEYDFLLDLGTRGLEVVTVGTADVTVIYD